MQYKIPVKIENEDAILFGLSFRQIAIVLVWVLIAGGIFRKLSTHVPQVPLLIMCGVVVVFFVIVAKFTVNEMSLANFSMNFVRMKVNGKQRYWVRGVDSYSPLITGATVYESWDPDKAHQKDISYDEMKEQVSKL